MSDGKRLVWLMVGGVSAVAVWRKVSRDIDPLPSIAGASTAGFMLLMFAEISPGTEKISGAFAALIAFAIAGGYVNNTVPAGGNSGVFDGLAGFDEQTNPNAGLPPVPSFTTDPSAITGKVQ